MEDKLELKEVAAYLPYGLNTQYRLGDVIDTHSPNEIRKKLLTPLNVDFVLNYCKPILFPLDSLIKEIEVNGERFVPVDVIYKIWNEKGLSAFSKKIIKDKILSYTESMPYWLVLLLHKWKLDVDRLIERGLAIAVTEEFNPYK